MNDDVRSYRWHEFTEFLDLLRAERAQAEGDRARWLSIAITELETGELWLLKAWGWIS